MKTVEFDTLLVQTIGVTSACMHAQTPAGRRVIKHHKPSPASRRGAYKQARNEDRRIR